MQVKFLASCRGSVNPSLQPGWRSQRRLLAGFPLLSLPLASARTQLRSQRKDRWGADSSVPEWGCRRWAETKKARAHRVERQTNPLARPAAGLEAREPLARWQTEYSADQAVPGQIKRARRNDLQMYHPGSERIDSIPCCFFLSMYPSSPNCLNSSHSASVRQGPSSDCAQ